MLLILSVIAGVLHLLDTAGRGISVPEGAFSGRDLPAAVQPTVDGCEDGLRPGSDELRETGLNRLLALGRGPLGRLSNVDVARAMFPLAAAVSLL